MRSSLRAAVANRRSSRQGLTSPSASLISRIDSAVTILWLLTPLSAGTAAIVVFVAMTTNNWLHTVERWPNPMFNGSGDGDFLKRETVSGLWRICHTSPGGTSFSCVYISYYSFVQYEEDLIDPANAIPYAVMRSAAPLLLATLGLAFGCVCCFLGHCIKGKRLCTFIAGVTFILSGLIMLLGIIMYISTFKAEASHKLRYASVLNSPKMTYRYGYSFILYVSGFIAVELAGTSSIYLFLNWYRKDWLHQLMQDVKADCSKWEREIALSEPREVVSCLQIGQTARREYCPAMASTSCEAHRRSIVKYPIIAPHCSIHRNRKPTSKPSFMKDLSPATLYGFPPAPQPSLCESNFEDPPLSANTLSGIRSVSIFQSLNSIASGKYKHSHQNDDDEFVTFAIGKEDAGRRTLPRRGTPCPSLDKQTTPV